MFSFWIPAIISSSNFILGCCNTQNTPQLDPELTQLNQLGLFHTGASTHGKSH